MFRLRAICLFFTGLIISIPCLADHEIAITIDDLPFVGANNTNGSNMKRIYERFDKLMQSLIENDVPATGFIIANSILPSEWGLLNNFRQAGFGLGNHTYSHENLNHMSAEKYIENIDKADKILSNIMTEPKYFRYPYLAEGKGQTKEDVQNYLIAHHYVVAPVTIDSKDYEFNERLLRIPFRQRPAHLSQIKQQYLAYVWQQTLKAEKHDGAVPHKQILLIHANLLNSHFLGDLIQMYKDHGYRFISLTDALSGENQAIPLKYKANPTNLKNVTYEFMQDNQWLVNVEKTW